MNNIKAYPLQFLEIGFEWQSIKFCLVFPGASYLMQKFAISFTPKIIPFFAKPKKLNTSSLTKIVFHRHGY